MKIIFCVLLALLITINYCDTAELDSISDDDLVQLFKRETYLVVLFSKKNCDDCDKIEKILFANKDDIHEKLEAEVVKAFNSQLARLYSPTKEPALVFFRHGVPLLYDGPLNEDSILTKFDLNKDPVVKELTDEVFEHLTQASTGSTTGDWFVQFYTQECVDCQRLSAVWEAVGAALKTRMNVARINKGTTGSATAERFKIQKVPEFILIRQGKFYRYEISKYDVKSFVSFAQEFFKNATPEKIIKPSTPFDNLVAASVIYLKKFSVIGISMANDHPYVVLFLISGFGLTLLLAVYAKLKATKTTSAAKKKTDDKKTTDEKKKDEKKKAK